MPTDGAPPPFRAVLCTGASGFVGQHVVRELLRTNAAAQVRCLTRRPTPELQELEAASGGRVKICVGDMLGAALRATVGPHLVGDLVCDGVINCAAHYRWWSPTPALYDQLNAVAAGELAGMAAECGVRQFVQVSTVLAMGCPPGGEGSSAERPLLPDTPPGPAASRYARSKAAGDAAVLRVAATAPASAASASAVPSAATAAATPASARATEAEAPGAVASAGAAGAAAAAAAAAQATPAPAPAPAAAAASRPGLGACVVCLGCVVGADRRLVSPQEDVMRIADLVRGQVPASLGHSTTFTYIGVRDAAAAVVAALLRGRTGRRYLVGNQRLTTGQYYDVLASLSGTPPPRRTVPVWLAAGWAAAAAAWGALTGVPPQAPPDLIRTVAYGTLLYDSTSSEEELGLQVPYKDIQGAFAEAVRLIQRHDAAQREAAAAQGGKSQEQQDGGRGRGELAEE